MSVKATLRNLEFLKVAFTDLEPKNCRAAQVAWETGAAQERMKRATCSASASPASSWRKWPAPAMIGCSRPAAPGMARWRTGDIGPVIGSESENAHRNGISKPVNVFHAARWASEA